MRFFTVGNAKEARKSVVYATGFVGYFYLLIAVVGLREYRDWETDRKSTRLNSSHSGEARMPSSA